MKIDQYEFPDDLLYDKDHNWVKIDGNTATIGMTDFGQALAGEIVYAEIPRVGRQIEQGQPFMSLESGKWVGRVKAIVSGKIVEANEEIEWESTIINEEPYGQGRILGDTVQRCILAAFCCGRRTAFLPALHEVLPRHHEPGRCGLQYHACPRIPDRSRARRRSAAPASGARVMGYG